MQKIPKKSKNENSLSDYEISIIKTLLDLGITNQEVLGYINHRRRDVKNHINIGRITDIKKGKRGTNIPPANKENAISFAKQYENPIQKDKELEETLRVSKNNPNFLITKESEYLEFKKSFAGYQNEKILTLIQGMANNKGGYILFGIEEKDGERGKEGEILGLGIEDIQKFNCDAKDITNAIEAYCDDEIEYKRYTELIGDKETCILQILESENKPIINKQGSIYYRYAGETKKIKKLQLEYILRKRMEKDAMAILTSHLGVILKNGFENSAILNVTTGNIEGKSGNFLIDEALLPKIAFIKEGEFVETKGAPTLVLKGEVEATAILKTEQKVDIGGDDRVYECFFKSEELAPDEAKEYLNKIARSPIELFPMRFFTQKAGMNKEKIIEYLKTCKDKRKIERKTKELEENQPEKLKIGNTIECEKLKKENLSNLANRNGEIRKWLTNIRSYDEQTIRKEKDFLLELTQKLYDYCSADKTQYKNLLSQIRKTIAYLDRVLYPLD